MENIARENDVSISKVKYILTDDINVVRKYYGKKYRPILNALEKAGATKYKLDTTCYGYLELVCELHGTYFFVNVGINNKYNTTYGMKNEYRRARNAFDTMREVAEYIEKL